MPISVKTTQRKRSKDAQREKVENLRRMATVVSDSNDAVILHDLDGKILAWNRGAKETYGYTETEALGMNVRDMVAESDQEAALNLIQRIKQGEVVKSFELRRVAKDGRMLDVWLTTTLLTDELGKPSALATTERDITERKRAEASLQEQVKSLRRMATVVSDSNDAVILHDLDGVILAWNRGAKETYGYTEAEALGMNVRDMVAPSDQEAARDLIKRIKQGEVVKSFELRRVAKDGRMLDVWLTTTLLTDETGMPAALATTERDITERRKNDRLALRSQRLESLGTLAGGVAHDLNNALAPIMMGVELLKMRYPTESKMIDIFGVSAKRGADMVRQLLTFAKGAEGERVPTKPSRLVGELRNLINGSFPKNIELEVNCSASLPMVVGDATQIHQILLNLCVNARDAMPLGGKLTIEAQQVDITADEANAIPDAKAGSFVVLRVGDTGSGIPQRILDRIFEPFFTTKGPDKGTGLGLSTVMGIAKGHGGFVQVISQLGQGSTFSVYLPAGKAGTAPGFAIKEKVAFRGQGETILLVDDEPLIREMARTVLRDLNFTPLTAFDGADGLIQSAEHRTEICAVITDLHMPHLDGLEFARVLRRMLPEIPIVVTSGRMDEVVIAEFKRLGVVTFLNKPFNEEQLAETLKHLLESRVSPETRVS